MDDWRKIGIGLSTAGAFFTILGVLMFFDKALLAMGNVRASSDCCRCRKRAAHSCLQDHLSYDPTSHVRPQLLFLAGVVLLIGFEKTFRFFFQMRKWKGTACFFGGIMLVLFGWAMIGMCVEFWGFLNLFSDFFPIALGLMRNMPVIGSILSWSPIRAVRQQHSNSAHALRSSSLPPPSPVRYMRSAWL